MLALQGQQRYHPKRKSSFFLFKIRNPAIHKLRKVSVNNIQHIIFGHRYHLKTDIFFSDQLPDQQLIASSYEISPVFIRRSAIFELWATKKDISGNFAYEF